MGEQSASRLEGDRYQHLYSWFELLDLIDEKSQYDHAFVEHPSAGAADDVTLHPKASSNAPAKFVQVKWHVDFRGTYDVDTLVADVDGAPAVLKKLHASWRQLTRDGPECEVWLVSNWAVAPDLGAFVEARGSRIAPALFDGGKNGKAGRLRKRLSDSLGASDDELKAFCSSLVLRLGFSGIDELEKRVDERMQLYSLKRGAEARAIAIDEVKRLIELGGPRKKVTRDSLKQIIADRSLLAPVPSEPLHGLVIHGWVRQAYSVPNRIELDWTSHFDRDTRRVPDETVWRTLLLPQLRTVRDRLTQLPEGRFIDLRGKMPLTTMIAVGCTFPVVGGFRFRGEQPTRGALNLWRSDAAPSGVKLAVEVQNTGVPNSDVVVVLSITDDAKADVSRFLAAGLATAVSTVYWVTPESGPGEASIQSDGDAVALAAQTKELLQRTKRSQSPRRIHLFAYGPAMFCLMVGQTLNAIGEVVTYERTADGGYARSIVLLTG